MARMDLPRAARRMAFAAGMTLAIAGCAPQQPAERLAIALPDEYRQIGLTRSVIAPAIPLSEVYGDPVLTTLVEAALSSNIGLQIAQKRVERANIEANAAEPLVNISATLAARESAADDSANLSVGIGLLGGRLARKKATLERALGSALDRDATRQLLVSNVIAAYVDLRFQERRRADLREELALRREGLDRLQFQFDAGSLTRVDVRQGELLVIETQRALPAIEAAIQVQRQRLAVLLGGVTPRGDLLNQRSGQIPLPKVNTRVSYPADLLRDRPEIRAQEARYAAALSDLDAARAARYPSISLSGDLGVVDLGGANTRTEDAVFGINIPIFNQGALNARVKSTEEQVNIALLEWRQAVISAMEEAENALTRLRAARQTEALARRAVAVNEDMVELLEEVLLAEQVTVIEFTRALRDLSNARLSLADARRQVALETARLQLALGQIWTTPDSVPPAPAPSG